MSLAGAIESGKIVVVAGAGISKAPPANLPSWWEYNRILVDSIGKIGSQYLNLDGNVLNAEDIIEKANVVIISQLFVNHLANDLYFDLLSLLDGVQPNENHLLLAELAKKKIISAIITTNFDTLLEKAFTEKNVPYYVCSTPADYEHNDSVLFPIYKIHGSADKSKYAIDTVMQKLAGLSVGKKEVMRELFAKNHVLFMGFSGEDFLIDSDYIPISSCREGITWISHPGSKFNAQTTKLISDLKIDVQNKELRAFYSEYGWTVPAVDVSTGSSLSNFDPRAREAIEKLLDQPFINPVNCAGMCIQLLDFIGDKGQADLVANLLQERIDNNKTYIIDIPALTQMALYYLRRNNYKEAVKMCLRQLQKTEFLAKEANEPLYEYGKNKSTILCNLALAYNQLNLYEEALACLPEAFICACNARNWENIAYSLFLLAQAREKKPDNNPELFLASCYYAYKAAMNVAKHGGVADRIVEIGISFAGLCKYLGLDGECNEVKMDVETSIPLSVVDRDAASAIIKKLETNIQAVVSLEMDPAFWLFGSDLQDSWDPVTRTPILRYPEGRKAKELFETQSLKKCKKYIKETIEKSIASNQIDLAYAMLDALIAIIIEQGKEERLHHNISGSFSFFQKAELLLKQLIKIELQLFRVDRVAQTVSELTRLYRMWGQYDKNYALFFADLTLCLCTDPKVFPEMLDALILAAKIHCENCSYQSAREYCERYIEIQAVVPDSVNELDNVEMAMLYTEALRNSIPKTENLNSKHCK